MLAFRTSFLYSTHLPVASPLRLFSFSRAFALYLWYLWRCSAYNQALEGCIHARESRENKSYVCPNFLTLVGVACRQGRGKRSLPPGPRLRSISRAGRKVGLPACAARGESTRSNNVWRERRNRGSGGRRIDEVNIARAYRLRNHCNGYLVWRTRRILESQSSSCLRHFCSLTVGHCLTLRGTK